MDKYIQLRETINDALPEMRNLTDGAIVEIPHWNIFRQCEDGFEELEVFNHYIWDTTNDSKVLIYNIWQHYDSEKTKVFRHPMLHHVLRWLQTSTKHNVTCVNDIFYLDKDSYTREYVRWDYSKEYLKEQSEDVLDFFIKISHKMKLRHKISKQPSK